jgi:hypothetical protein
MSIVPKLPEIAINFVPFWGVPGVAILNFNLNGGTKFWLEISFHEYWYSSNLSIENEDIWARATSVTQICLAITEVDDESQKKKLYLLKIRFN